MSMPRQYFWSRWPMVSQYRFFKIVLYGIVVATFAVSVGLKLFVGILEKRIGESRERYGQVLDIVEDIRALRAQQGDLVSLPVEDAAWAIIDNLVIEDQLTFIRSAKLDDGAMGIRVRFEGLSLAKLTDFMLAFRDRASLQTPDCSITRNPDDPRLADAEFVLAR